MPTGTALDDCCFCQELATGQMPDEYAALAGVNERIFARDSNFVALPAVSPIRDGHVLILPTTHVTSYAQLSSNLVPSFDEFLRATTQTVTSKFGSVFLWEHGVARGGQVACGVSHAHVHLLPLESDIARNLHDSLLKELPNVPLMKFSDLRDIAGTSAPYLFWGSGDLGFFASIGGVIPSQLVRKKITELLGSPDWDWKGLTAWDRFLTTRTTLRT